MLYIVASVAFLRTGSNWTLLFRFKGILLIMKKFGFSWMNFFQGNWDLVLNFFHGTLKKEDAGEGFQVGALYT